LGVTNNPSVLLSDRNNGKRAMFQSGASATINSNDVAGTMAIINACKALPGTTASISSYRNGQIWVIAHPWATAFNRYNHVGTPNTISCETTKHGRHRHHRGRQCHVVVPTDKQPPGRRQSVHGGRLGPLHQGHHRSANLVGARHPRRWGDHQLRCLLIFPGQSPTTNPRRSAMFLYRSFWSLIFVVCVIAGCGPASGIQPGIPTDNSTTPVNPTPDMGPAPSTGTSPKK
jgi:hypothetical protein